MNDRLVIGILGHPNAGKSKTWNKLFGRNDSQKVQTGKNERELWLSNTECVDVFLINGSPEERHIPIEEIIDNKTPSIVLCSMQYTQDVRKTISYFTRNDYHLFIHWLNPGFRDLNKVDDSLNLIPDILSHHSLVGIRDGKSDPAERVSEIRCFLHEWATFHNILKPNNTRLVDTE